MIIHPNNTEHIAHFGGKAKALAALHNTNLNIPPWFVVTHFTEEERASILAAAQELDAKSYAVRSSAASEDGAQYSFAGQYDTFLNVQIHQLVDKIQLVEESAKSKHLDSYQSSQSIKDHTKPSVLIQRMLSPDVSGVAFSADPISGNLDHTVISAVWGTGSALVSGEVDADSWTIDTEQELVRESIAHKSQQHTACSTSKEGVVLMPTAADKVDIPCLSPAQRLEVHQLAHECEKHFGSPQDIEWAYDSGVLYLLQSRPITTIKHSFRNSDPLTVWDNSNIAESYSGITSTMTFSFAERAYENVYREFCKVLSVPTSRITASDSIFKSMLGHIHGHVYYNLNSWYHVLALLPGFSLNRSFMEQMMGVKEPMPDKTVQRIIAQTKVSKFSDTCALVKTAIGLIRNHKTLEKQIESFYSRLNDALNEHSQELDTLNGARLAKHYRKLENQLLQRWDAPLINDFFAMIFYGLLRSLCEKWLGDASLQNNFLVDTGDIVSAEPPRRIKEMAKLASKSETLTTTLASSNFTSQEKLEALQQHSELVNAYTDYLDKFGDRCLEELKLESPTVEDDPASLLSGIGGMAQRIRSGQMSEDPLALKTPEIPLNGIKSKLFRWVLKQAKNRVRDRENLRFERTRLFGRVRKIIVLMGAELQSKNLLKNSQDVFYLTISELMGVYEATHEPSLLKGLVEERKSRAQQFITPPDRFETRGEITDSTPLTATTSNKESYGVGDILGTGACPGIVQGFVRVVDDPRNATIKQGEILVAQQTDPGWVVLFPAASGLLVERGSLLSHSAIVARELQLPCVVSIPHVTTTLKTGDYVEMNGSTGTVELIDHEI